MTQRVDPRIRVRLAELSRDDVPAAELRRLVRPLAAELGLPCPSYSSVLRIVTASRRRSAGRRNQIGVLDSLVLGRMPTPRELEETLARALEHND